ncbi:OmpA family protein [Burkholderiaceae bacterium FT117]|uniref:OmpA family protein n=1 Tax=Zeimonas sediminis TaxID=2944268 RepID=UPI0023431374|nr:OmpA family protein [Zeimonas sediminis]MCM5569987.1 OmpA family protein [Zeimonas sediminis]
MQLNQSQSPETSSAVDAAAAQAARQVAEPTRIFFDGDSTDVRDNYVDLIRDHAERFNSGPGGTLIVSGHANPVEDPEEAVALSMDRTQAVASLLEKFGVQSHRIVRVSHGANAPIADVEDERANWANRCVEIRQGSLTPRQPVWSQRSRKNGARR